MYLIIGGSGFLGKYIIKNILELTDDDIYSTYSSKEPNAKCDRVRWFQLDVTDINRVKELQSIVGNNVKIIYLASYHNPDKVLENPDIAWEHNIVALTNFVNIFSKANCLYYSSSDSVYGNGTRETSFKESSILNPVNLYGKQKVLAEQITIAKGFNVIRYPFIFGPSLVENKKHFFDDIKQMLSEGKSVEMFNDSYRSTLDFNQCAKLLIKLIERYCATEDKIINISGDDALSKYDVATQLASYYGYDINLVVPILMESSEHIFKAQRASTTILDNTKIKSLLGLKSIKMRY